MRHYYFKLFLNAIVYSVLLFANNQLRAQTPSTMEFGSSTAILATGTDPSADQSASSLLNNFDISSTSNGNITLALATSGNGVGTNAIGGATDAVLAWAGNGSSAVSSATLSTDSGGEVGITSIQFAYEQAVGGTIIDFTFTGKKNGVVVGTLSLVSPTHNSAISIDFTSPTTGSFSDIDELIITPDTEIFGGFSIDEMIVTSAVSNTAPVIGGTTAGQSVNDNSTISPFSSITTTDTDGDNLSATITLDNNAKGLLTGTGLSGSGPYTIATTTPTDLQSKLRALSFNPTDNRTATSETTTFTVVINDGTTDDTDNTTTVISNAVAPTVSSVSVPANATYVTGENLDFTVNFDENVTVNTTGGIPQIAITIGATTRQATYISGSGTSSLVFRHTILTGDLDTDGIAVGSLAANGSTLKDAGGKDANLTLNSVGSTAAVLVDAAAPTVTSVSVPANGNYLTGQNLDFTVNFDENIIVNTTGGTPQIAITIGATTRQAVYQSGSGTSALIFRYTIQSGDSDTDGIAVGTLAANGGTLKDDASNDAVLTLNSVGSTTNVLVGIETVTWSGSTDNDWNTASNWSPSVVPPTNANVIVPSSLTNYPTASSAVTFNSLTINNGASFIPQSTVTGTVTYKRSLPTTNWYLVSPPVAGETLEDIIANHTLASGTGGNLGLAPYSNITGDAWFYVQSGNTGTITNGTGVSIKLATPGDVSISGTANTSNIAKAISTGSRTNYNLVGNPYTSYINSANFAAANTAILTEETIWLWNGSQYITKNAIDDIEIAPGQGFFVEAAASNNLIFAFSNQSHQNSDTFMRQEPIPSIELSVNNNDIKRSTKVFYASGKTKGYDRSYDSKMFGEDTSDLAVFTELLTNNQGKQLAIQTLPNNDYENMVIPVGLRALSGEKVTFSINTKNIPANLKVYLEDRINNVFTDLSEENYTTTLNKDSNSIGQFYLHTSSEKPTSIIEPSLDNISIYSSSNNEITITGLQTEANIAVYSILGKEIINRNIISNGVSKVSIPSVATGVYIVKLNSNLGEVSKKVILK
ncbi:T9SS type A sorting domain-containing protein [Tenacibaculum larymnensis]|uniref:T9SS type A sorting domain-containing protein n=1 Tax=Tenacibaculum larymnensis TaxID=2878201 RepID=A0A9X4IL00_9FLAO|nr:T9SS type A sorting domain-containing protein [Tenacibaculum larymnensis]MDE1206064.1 T9SS type A sorting domain-containing protein [Tenacibaculum larymnensis]